MKDAGMNQINLSFAQIASINALLSGDYSKGAPNDQFLVVLKMVDFYKGLQ